MTDGSDDRLPYRGYAIADPAETTELEDLAHGLLRRHPAPRSAVAGVGAFTLWLTPDAGLN